jgi:hypothetical protein
LVGGTPSLGGDVVPSAIADVLSPYGESRAQPEKKDKGPPLYPIEISAGGVLMESKTLQRYRLRNPHIAQKKPTFSTKAISVFIQFVMRTP